VTGTPAGAAAAPGRLDQARRPPVEHWSSDHGSCCSELPIGKPRRMPRCNVQHRRVVPEAAAGRRGGRRPRAGGRRCRSPRHGTKQRPWPRGKAATLLFTRATASSHDAPHHHRVACVCFDLGGGGRQGEAEKRSGPALDVDGEQGVPACLRLKQRPCCLLSRCPIGVCCGGRARRPACPRLQAHRDRAQCIGRLP